MEEKEGSLAAAGVPAVAWASAPEEEVRLEEMVLEVEASVVLVVAAMVKQLEQHRLQPQVIFPLAPQLQAPALPLPFHLP